MARALPWWNEQGGMDSGCADRAGKNATLAPTEFVIATHVRKPAGDAPATSANEAGAVALALRPAPKTMERHSRECHACRPQRRDHAGAPRPRTRAVRNRNFFSLLAFNAMPHNVENHRRPGNVAAQRLALGCPCALTCYEKPWHLPCHGGASKAARPQAAQTGQARTLPLRRPNS